MNYNTAISEEGLSRPWGAQVGRTLLDSFGSEQVTIRAKAAAAGMVCDGAKPSGAAKIACAVDCALTALHLSQRGNVFQPGEGLVKSNVEETIQSVGRMGREGMKATDIEILNIMLEN